MNEQPHTGDTIIIAVPPNDICAFADHYRQLYMPDHMYDIEPHITIAGPLMPYDELPERLPRLREAISACAPVRMSLRDFGCFREGGVLYLRPAYPERIIYLYKAILAEFPDYPAYGGKFGDDLVPHMTVGLFSDPAELERVYAELSEMRLYLGWIIDSLVLKYKANDGIWRTVEEILLNGKELNW